MTNFKVDDQTILKENEKNTQQALDSEYGFEQVITLYYHLTIS